MLVLTEDMRFLQDAARDMLAREAPVEHFRRLRDRGAPVALDAGLWRRMADLGWTGVLAPEPDGGSNLGFAGACVICEEAGRTLAATPFIATAMMAVTALRFNSGALASLWVPRIVAGEAIVAVGVDEGRRHAPERIALQACRTNEGYRLTGRKTFVMDAPDAEAILVSAVTPDAPAAVGLFLAPLRVPGMTLDVISLVDGRACADVIFEDVAVDAAAAVAIGGPAADLLDRVLDAGRLGLAAELSGIAQECQSRTIAYLKQRQQFGRLIGSFQALQHRAAHLYCEIETLKSSVMAAAQALDENSPTAAVLVSLAKAKGDSVATLAAAEAVQMHGGIGMTDEVDLGLFLKRIRVASQLYGDADFHADRFALAQGY